MKKVILALAIILSISTANAQTSSKMEMRQKHKMAMKEGVMMMNNHVMLCSQDKCTPLTKTYICTNGSKVSPDGTITKPDGSKMKLMNGYAIDKSGKLTMMSHGKKGHVCGQACHMPKKM